MINMIKIFANWLYRITHDDEIYAVKDLIARNQDAVEAEKTERNETRLRRAERKAGMFVHGPKKTLQILKLN